MKSINDRLNSLREIMRQEHLGAFIFPSTDPHNGEYVPEHWEGRKWISGFTGSAGTAVVTLHSAALWTDSRYFIAAEQELAGTEYQLMKLKMQGTPTISQWISHELASCDKSCATAIGVDGYCYSTSEMESLIAELRAAGGITVRTNLDPLKTLWTDRPAIPLSPVEIQSLQYCGMRAKDKLAAIRRQLRSQHADGMLIAALDDIAWTLNIRAQDVHCCPVAVSYLLISTDKATIYINKVKLSAAVIDYFAAEGVEVDEYENIGRGLERYPEYNILLDADEINYNIYNKVKCRVVRAASPVPAMKAVKSDAEVEGYRRAMLRDGVALVKFTKWLKDSDKTVEERGLTELSLCDKLYELRSQQDLFRDISFDTIAGYGPHGAIVHYEPTLESDIPLQAHGFVLIDSGAHYQDGTTDITRTVPLGPLTDEEKLVYTLVLKGHIGLEMLKFPDGASGTQLDAVARKDMWAYGYNYLHGTGHGVGSYLSVHEGPHQIRMEYRPAPLHQNMTVTDEPGVYLEGKFGVRIENTLLIRKYETPLERKGVTLSPTPMFLEFDTLTLCPIDTEPILWDLMSPDEVSWLNAYHKRVYDELSPYLTDDEKAWLHNACSAR